MQPEQQNAGGLGVALMVRRAATKLKASSKRVALRDRQAPAQTRMIWKTLKLSVNLGAQLAHETIVKDGGPFSDASCRCAS